MGLTDTILLCQVYCLSSLVLRRAFRRGSRGTLSPCLPPPNYYLFLIYIIPPFKFERGEGESCMECSLKKGLVCPLENVYGACFFCTKINESYAVSKIPVLEADIISTEEEN